MKRLFALMLAALAATAGAEASRAQARLVVYTTLEQEFIDGFRKAFEADHPDIRIEFLRDSTGVITARLQAEKATPRADAIWGLAVTSAMVLDAEGILQPYRPAHFEQLRPVFRDPKPDPAWFGMEAWSAAICFNTIEAGKRGLPAPRTWEDLAGPAFRGLVQMPNPASSGTGFFHVSGWIQMMGEEKAWAFMDRLHQNVASYVHSGSKPCRDAATGEFPVGIAYELLGAQLKTRGAPIETLIMEEGGGWDMDVFAIVRGTRNLEAARRLADWASSRKANEMYAAFATQVAWPGIENRMPNYPAGVEESLIRNDFAWAAANRARILAEWTRRYDGKSAPK
ncbi:MAG: putative 2-aminoethylphosphonate ABC transporter substrate-binding protein [Alphaproteobacteria bacterium]|nr:putative 2-aminoethylphosphonate ABC transporter substrate-binding protein [Alphaproteobacteria bacterium]